MGTISVIYILNTIKKLCGDRSIPLAEIQNFCHREKEGEIQQKQMGALKEVNNEVATKYKVNKRRTSKAPFLCYEIIFHILVWLPADVLYKTMRYVCKQWYHIIKDTQFIKKQLLLCPPVSAGLFFQCYSERDCCFALFSKKRWGAVSKLFTLPCPLIAKENWHFVPEMISNLLVVDTCDGLILVQNKTTKRISVVNPLTKQLLTLPPINCKYSYSCTGFALGRARSTMDHKVVYICEVDQAYQICGVITLGKDDSWRPVYVPQLSLSTFLHPRRLHRVGSFMYWPEFNGSLITFDMKRERFYVSNLPKREPPGDNLWAHLLIKGGDTLTCLMGSHYTTTWEVWVSPYNKKIPKWKRSHVINFLPQKHKLRRMVNNLFRESRFYTRPVAWINNGDVLVFRTSCKPDPFIAYNVQTGTFCQLRWHDHHKCDGFIKSFAPSLLSLN